jgi:hypothetical protein
MNSTPVSSKARRGGSFWVRSAKMGDRLGYFPIAASMNSMPTGFHQV